MANQYQRDVFKDRLIAARKDAGLTQRELARRIGVSHGTISQWEAATAAPREDVVARLEKALGLPEDSFAGLLGYLPYSVQMQAVATVTEAIEHDARLDSRDRQILTAMYRELLRAHTNAVQGIDTADHHDERDDQDGPAAAVAPLAHPPVTLTVIPRPPADGAASRAGAPTSHTPAKRRTRSRTGQSPPPAARRRSTN